MGGRSGVLDDIRRVSKWIDSIATDLPFSRFDIWNGYCGVICYEVIDAVITAKLNRNELITSKDYTDRYYKKKAGVEKVDTDIKSQLLDIEILLKKIYEKVDALPEKKQRPLPRRLWIQHNMQTSLPGGMLFVDIMLASGEVVLNMRADQVAWKYYPDASNVIAWREAE